MLDYQIKQWDQVARSWPSRGYDNEILAEYKRKTYFNLLMRWTDVANSQSILKTDLFEEAFGQEQFLSDIARVNKRLVGIDLSNEVVDRARKQAKGYGLEENRFICCDIRQLPFRNNSFHLIISNSTLDHFPSENDIVVALKELRRVLRVGGTLILMITKVISPILPTYLSACGCGSDLPRTSSVKPSHLKSCGIILRQSGLT